MMQCLVRSLLYTTFFWRFLKQVQGSFQPFIHGLSCVRFFKWIMMASQNYFLLSKLQQVVTNMRNRILQYSARPVFNIFSVSFKKEEATKGFWLSKGCNYIWFSLCEVYSQLQPLKNSRAGHSSCVKIGRYTCQVKRCLAGEIVCRGAGST